MTNQVLDQQIINAMNGLSREQLAEVLNGLPDSAVKALATIRLPGQTTKYASPLELAKSLDGRVVSTPALELISKKLVETYNTPDGRLIISMPPQEGKSQLASRRFPEWILTQNPDATIAVVSYELGVARRWGRYIRDDLNHNPMLGLKVRSDMSAQHEWQLEGYDGGIYSIGIGGALTGRSISGALIIDDPIKDRLQADSKVYRDRVLNWWTDVGSTRLAPGTPVVLILTRWHHDDLAGRLIKADKNVWDVINIPAQAEENDPLGRIPGQYLESARGRTEAQWDAIKLQVGPRTWGALYQGNPSPDQGGLFPSEWTTYDTPMWTEDSEGRRFVPNIDEMVQSWDLAFKGEKTSDYVVGQVWARRGVTIYLVDQVRERMDANRTLAAIKEMSAKWPQSSAKFVEDKANGPAVINLLSNQVPGLIPVEPQGSKYQRAASVSPFVHSGNIVLPDPSLLPSVGELLEEARGFPSAAHDDTIDALSQAGIQLLIEKLDDEDDEDELDHWRPVDDPHAYLGF